MHRILKMLGIIILIIIGFLFSMSFGASTIFSIDDTKILIETITVFFGFFGVCAAQLLVFNGGRIDKLKDKKEKYENNNQIKKELNHATKRSHTLKRYLILTSILYILSLFCAIFLFGIQSVSTEYLTNYKEYGANIIAEDPTILVLLIPSIFAFMFLFLGLISMVKLIHSTIQEQCDSFKDDI